MSEFSRSFFDHQSGVCGSKRRKRNEVLGSMSFHLDFKVFQICISYRLLQSIAKETISTFYHNYCCNYAKHVTRQLVLAVYNQTCNYYF